MQVNELDYTVVIGTREAPYLDEFLLGAQSQDEFLLVDPHIVNFFVPVKLIGDAVSRPVKNQYFLRAGVDK